MEPSYTMRYISEVTCWTAQENQQSKELYCGSENVWMVQWEAYVITSQLYGDSSQFLKIFKCMCKQWTLDPSFHLGPGYKAIEYPTIIQAVNQVRQSEPWLDLNAKDSCNHLDVKMTVDVWHFDCTQQKTINNKNVLCQQMVTFAAVLALVNVGNGCI